MLFARWQHHFRFCSGFPYAPLKAMVTKISEWSRIQDSFRITHKIEPLVAFAIPDMPSKIQKDPSITFWVILLTHRQTNKNRQKHNLLGGGKNKLFITITKHFLAQNRVIWRIKRKNRPDGLAYRRVEEQDECIFHLYGEQKPLGGLSSVFWW